MNAFFRVLLLALATAVAGRAAPTVSVSVPSGGSTFQSGTATTLTATATPTAGSTITQVVFFANGQQVGSPVAASPYSVLWNTPTSSGSVAITAQATDNSVGNPAVTSSPVNVTIVAVAPTVTLTSPTNGATVAVNGSVTMTATATGNGGATVGKVEFLAGSTVVGTALLAPYSITWTPTASGVTALTARVTDSNNTPVTSAVVNVSVTAPTVTLTSPVAGTSVTLGTATSLVASASVEGPATVTKVDFFAGATLVGTATTAPYSADWTPAAAGAASLSARVTNSMGATTTSTAVAVTVLVDPTLTTIGLSISPGVTTLPVGATRNVLATVTPGTGRAIARVEFFVNGGKVGEKTSAPFNFRYTAGAAGSYAFSAKATDNGGATREAQLNLLVVAAVGVKPVATLAAPANNSTIVPNAATTLSGAAFAQGGTLSALQFYVNGGPVGNSLGAPPYAVAYNPPSPGGYTIDLIAMDDRGNSTVSSAVFVTAAFGTPTIAIVSPGSSGTVRATPGVPLTLATTATGGGGAGVLLVELLIDGIPVSTRTAPTATGGTSYAFTWTPTAADLGAHQLTTRVTDANLSITVSAPVTVNVATVVGTPPTVSLTTPANNATVQSLSSVNFVASAFATGGSITTVEFFLNDISIGLSAREQATNTYRLPFDFTGFNFSTLQQDAQGRYQLGLYAIAKDSNGNQTVSTTFTLFASPSTSLAPGVVLVPLGVATVTAGTQFAIGTTVSDPDGTVTQAQLFANGAAVATVPNPQPGALFTYTPNAAGRFNLYAVATDDTGNTAVSSPVLLTVTGNAAPTSGLVRPGDNSTVTTVNVSVFLEATASDADVGQTVTVTFINTTNGQTLATGQRVGTADTYRAIWTPAAPGTFTVAARAVDTAGATSVSAESRRVVVTSLIGLAPAVTLNVPVAATTASTANFTATATDSDGSVVGVEFFLNRNSIGQATRDQLTNTWRLTASFAGVTPAIGVEIVALARDTAGNVAASATSTVAVAAATSMAPSVAITASATDVAFSQQVQFTANARDTDGTIAAVQYFANGTAIGTSGNAATNYQINWTPNQSGTFNVWAVATDNSGNTTVAVTLPVTVRRNNPVLEDSAFILQTYQDIANTTTINPLVFASLNAQLTAGTLTRAQFAASLTGDPAFAPAVNLLAAYRVIMGQWPTPANYQALLPQARTSLAAAIGAILASNEYFAKFGAVPTVALLENPTSAIPEATFLARLWQGAGLGTPSALDHVRFRNNDTASATLGRGYTVAGLNPALAEFITNTNSTNAELQRSAQAAALYYQLARPSVTVTINEIAVRVTGLAKLADVTAMADAVLKDVLYAYRYVTILTHPQSLTVAPRSGALFGVDALGAPPLSYQWLLNGAPVPGATSPLLSLTNVDATRAGSYTVVVTSSAATATSDAATLALSSAPTRLANISTRGPTAGGADVLIGGFVVTGTGNRQMLIRAVGPTLAGGPFNVPGTLANPRLEVYNGTNPVPILANDDWGNQGGGATAVTAIQQAATRVSAFALPNNSADAAVLATLAPGSYTVQARGPVANATGLVLIEVYDVTPGTAGPRAVNVSTRGNIGTGNNILIAGFVVNGTVSRRLLIRGVGPTLTRFNLPAGAVLADPQLTLIDQATGRTLRKNDDWAAGDDAAIMAAAAVGAGAFPLTNGSKDAAMIVMLPPGGYTVHLSGVNNTTGIGIVEVYDVDP